MAVGQLHYIAQSQTGTCQWCFTVLIVSLLSVYVRVIPTYIIHLPRKYFFQTQNLTANTGNWETFGGNKSPPQHVHICPQTFVQLFIGPWPIHINEYIVLILIAGASNSSPLNSKSYSGNFTFKEPIMFIYYNRQRGFLMFSH